MTAEYRTPSNRFHFPTVPYSSKRAGAKQALTRKAFITPFDFIHGAANSSCKHYDGIIRPTHPNLHGLPFYSAHG